MANTYKNIVITPNTGSTTGDPTIVFSGGDTNTNTDITLRVYPTSNGTLSFEGNAGQLFSITNDLSNTIFSVNDVSGIPLLEINVASQQITLGQFYGNVGIGTNASNVNNYKLDVIGGANISLPNLTVGGTNVIAAIVAANANAATLSANVNTLAAATVANNASQGANIATLAAAFVSNSQSLSANVNTLAANVNTLAGAAYPKTGGTISGDVTVTGSLTVSGATTYVNTQTLLIGDNLVTLNADLPGNVQPTENAGLEINRGARTSNAAFIWNENANSWQFTSNTLAGVYSIIASQTDANNVGAAANNFAAATYLTQSAFNSANANSVSQSANVNVLAAAFVSNSQTLSANVNTLAAALVLANTSAHADIDALSVVANAKVSSVTGTSGRITSSGGTAPAIDLATAGAGAATYSSGISAVTVDAYGRVTSVTGSAGYLTTTDFNTANANSVSQSANVNVLAAAFVSNSQSLSANVNVLAAAVVANDASQGANIATLAASFVSNSQSLSANVNVLAASMIANTASSRYLGMSNNANLLDGYDYVDFEGYFLNTIDMTALANNTYYPVTISLTTGGQRNGNFVKFKLETRLNSGFVPSWATHPSGFTIQLDWEVNASGYGTSAVVRKILAYTEGWSSVTICGGIEQMTNDSLEVIYLRGGGKYYLYSSKAITPTVRTTSFTSTGQTVSPSISTNNNIWSAATGTVSIGSIISNGSSLTGTASSLTAGAVSGLTLNSSASAINPDNVTQNQIGYNTNVSLYGQSDGGLYSSAYSSAWIHQIYGDFRTGQIATRGKNNGTWQSWRLVVDTTNIYTYAAPITAYGALNVAYSAANTNAASLSANVNTLAAALVLANTSSHADIDALSVVANTKLANTSGVSFNGNLFFPAGNVGIGNTSPGHRLSVNGTSYFSGKITSAVSSSTDGIDLVTFDAYANMRVMRNAGGGTSDGMYIGYGNAGSATTKIYGGGATTGALEKFSDYTLEPGSFRSPIFYDSNNTAYYVDPAGLTNIDRMQINSANTGVVLSVGDSGLDSGSTYGMVNLTRAADTVRAHLAFIRSGNYVWQTGYLSGTNSLGFFPWNFSGSQGTPALYMTTGSIVYAPTEFRTPIIYDNNNTNYYFDGASTSVMNRIQFDTTNVAAPTTNQAVGSRLTLYPTGGTGHYSIGIEGSHMWFNTFSGYKWYVNETNWATLNADYFQHNSDIRAPIFYDSDNTGYYVDPAGTSYCSNIQVAGSFIVGTGGTWTAGSLYSDSNWGMLQRARQASPVLAQFAWYESTGTTQLLSIDTSYNLISSYSMRSPIFYDSNNTAYYVDPASTSILNKVTLSNGSSGVLNGLDDYHQIILRGYPSNATTGITATDVTSFSEYGGDFRFYRKNGSSLDLLTEINTDYLSHYSDIRTPIFYDSNNTGYYLDPASSSVLNAISCAGLITGRTDTAANTSVANDTGSMSIRGSTTKPATVSFHRAGAYAINMGLDTDNIFRIGGWSDGVNTYRVQLGTPGGTHTFTGTVAATTFSGAGTSLTGTAASLTAGNATTAGGFTPSQTNGVGSRIVVADGSGYINNNYFNSTDDVSAGTVSYIMAKFGDNYYRSATAAKVATFLASQSFASPTFTGTITIPGFNGTNEIKAGTGDGASFTTYNVTIRSHYGIGFRDYTDSTTVKAYIDCRTGNIGSSGSIIDAYGNLRRAPVDSKSAQYTLVATDTGKTISITTGGIIIPANVMSAGDIVTIFNNSGSSQTITTTGVTAYLAGTATTGDRTLLQRGVANILCVASNVFVISGSGLT